MSNSPITPAMNDRIHKATEAKLRVLNDFSKKAYGKAYNEAIKEAGYSPAYFKSVMAKIGPECGSSDDDGQYCL